MDKTASCIETEAELEERLSRPAESDKGVVRWLPGELMVLGVGGKMGPSLVRLASRACQEAGVAKRIVAVSRFTRDSLRSELEAEGVETIQCDLLNADELMALPNLPNIIFMAARKFGTSGAEHLTWAMNTYLPGLVAERFRESRIVTFSTGNVYPLRLSAEGGATEATRVAPVGEYAQSALGRERMFEYASSRWGTQVAILRLNYANDLRYGVLVDIGRAVFERRPVNVRMGLVNVIWQGDANRACLRALEHCQSPPNVINVTGPETISVRQLAREFGDRFGIDPVFEAAEGETALLNDAGKAHQLFGYPSVTARELIDWTAHWILRGGASLGKPTRFEVRDGDY